MSYFHPRDFDYNQPVLKDLENLRKFKSYVGIKNCKNKLKQWLSDFEFIDLRTADANFDWDNASVVNL